MNSLSKYITERLHIDKDIEVSETDVFKEISDVINNYLQKKLSLKTEDFLYMFEDDEGHITKDESTLARIYLYSKKFDPRIKERDIDKVSKYLENSINKIKPIEKTEKFVTSIYFYFK